MGPKIAQRRQHPAVLNRPHAKADRIEDIRKALSEIAGYNPETIGMGAGLGEVNFEKGRPIFEQVHELAEELSSLPFEDLPSNGVNWEELAQLPKSVLEILKQIAEFSIVGQGNPVRERDNLIQQIDSSYDSLLKAFLPYIPYLALRSAQVLEIVRQSKNHLEEAKEESEVVKVYLTKQQREVEDIVQATKDAAAKIGVARFAIKFEEIAKNHGKLATNWLIATAVGGAATLMATGLLVYFGPIWPLEKIPENSSVLPYVLTKLAFLSVLYYVTIWSSKNYKAHRHLTVLNEHRQNALSTFEIFVGASNDQQTKDAVLLEATRSIFSPAVTGYLAKEPDMSNNRVFEIFKTIGSGTEH